MLCVSYLDGGVLVGDQCEVDKVVVPADEDVVHGGCAAAVEKFGQPQEGGQTKEQHFIRPGQQRLVVFLLGHSLAVVASEQGDDGAHVVEQLALGGAVAVQWL